MGRAYSPLKAGLVFAALPTIKLRYRNKQQGNRDSIDVKNSH
nr:MAG TPA: hypothetical protein [Bacteriophage sp.]